MAVNESTPLLSAKAYSAPSVFEPANLLREARRQRNLSDLPVPAVCLLDPDGDIVAHLRNAGRATHHPGWACYHTDLYTFDLDGTEVGVVASAVGAPFAVLVAEQLHESGCRLLLSMTSAGLVSAHYADVDFVILERALRDEGTSHHYLAESTWASAPENLLVGLAVALIGRARPVALGASWTTDAPYRETAEAIERARELGIATVEMEAAGLYAYAQARVRSVLCIAHVTNSMATNGDDFEKGEHQGAVDALELLAAVISHRANGSASAS